MKLVVGLGNPGRKYQQTRHNVGFIVAAKVAALTAAGTARNRFEAEVAEGTLVGQAGAEKLVVLCPQTYMNASGKSVRKALDFYKLSPVDVLVICDDLNLPVGRLRIRAKGSAGGQKGLADIIRHLGTESVARLRIGINPPPPGWDAADYVLGKFTSEDKDEIESVTDRAAQAAIQWAREGTGFVMNRYNADPNAQTDDQKSKSKSKTEKPKRSATEIADDKPTGPNRPANND